MKKNNKVMLVLTDVCTGYGTFQSLFNVSMTVSPGEAVAVIGPNGAGKTSLMRVISGMIPTWSGKILMEGVPLNSVRPHQIIETGIAHVPEGRRLFPNLSVDDNLRLGAFSPSARIKCKEQLDFVYSLFPRIAERRKQLAGTMSGGEQQMCAVGRALMSDPKLLLMDEPSSGLAPVLMDRIFDLVRDIRKRGYTVLIVEQQLHQVLEVVDRAYLLEAGQVAAEGDAEELKSSEIVQKAYLGI